MANVKVKKDKTKPGIPIVTTITSKEWSAEVSEDDYIDFILDRVGNPSTLLTRKGLRNRFDAAREEFNLMMRKEIVKKV